ncbi:MAG: PH domain-containing protein [Flavobacteriales bacterium]
MPRTIASSYDRTSIWIIQVFIANLVLIALLVQANYAFIISIGLIFLFAIAVSFVLVPYRIQLDEKHLLLKRIAANIEFQLEDIEKLEIIEYAELRRKIGIDGLLGYYGYYELSGFGKVKLMAKGKKHLVLILSSTHEPIVISVDEVGELLSDNW